MFDIKQQLPKRAAPVQRSSVEPKDTAIRPQVSVDIVPRILIVDCDELCSEELQKICRNEGYRVTAVRDGERALRLLEQEEIDLVITDIQVPGLSGIQLTQRIVERWSDVPVIVITADGQIETAVDVLKMGASDYLVKPFGAVAIKESSRVALQKYRIFTEIRHLRRYLKDKCGFGGMLSKTPEMHRVFETIRRVAPTDSTVVIEGETGTGKELVASAIHQQSSRRNGPLVTINCSGVPETLLESELFGYERGAFTGAVQARPGKIELADGGTLFLDEIETMPISMQSRLLLTLNSQFVQRIGSPRWNRVDMRVIAATNVPLKDLVALGQMRSDIYYRLNVISIQLVPLRQRLQDIPLLVQDFLRHHPISIRKNITSASPEAMDHLMRHNWPGNIRELQNVLEKAIVLARSRVIEQVEVSDPFTEEDNTGAPVSREYSLEEWIQAQEKEYLIAKLQAHGGRIDLTARSCGVDVRTLHRKMRIYGLNRKVFHFKTTETIAE